MEEQQAELCSLIQSLDHLLIKESCLMDVCLEWGWGGSGEKNCFLLCVQRKSGSVAMSGNADVEK